MRILLSPVRRDDTLALERQGETLVLNGIALDLSAVPEGVPLAAEAVASEWIAGPIVRTAGVLEIPIYLPHGPLPNPMTPAALAVAFPAPIEAQEDGPITLPGLPARDD